jgi:hypothetical protein
MNVYFKTDIIAYEIGSDDFLNAFFSTIFYHLEKGKKGSRFPVLYTHLYRGKVTPNKLAQLLKELCNVKGTLEKFTPNQIIWDIDNLSKQPPWGNNISKDITSLANYFITSDGRDFFEVAEMAIQTAIENNLDLTIELL